MRKHSTSFLPLAVLAALPTAMAVNQCISLRGSTQCPAFNQSTVSTSDTLRGLFPFLAFVSDVSSFDSQFAQYITTGYSQQKYQYLLGCKNVNLTNTTNIYARYTATYLCNSIVQNSITPCSLNGTATKPMCADSCAAFALSEEAIASTPDLCGTNAASALNMIRADFTNCALPPDALTSNCIHAVQNEPDNCGFNNNLPSLCSYCAASSPNSTDSCCLYSKTETRCTGVKLPLTTSMGPLFPTATGGAAPSPSNKGLSGGAIAGIVIGSILGALLLLALIIGACLFIRKRQGSRTSSVFNQPSPTRDRKPPMAYASPTRTREPPLPHGARIHHMTALEGSSSNGDHSSPIGGGYLGSSSGYDETPESQRSGLGVAGVLPKRGGSLSRQEDVAGLNSSSSPNYGSSPEGMASGQSEQMSHFKDYYSSEDIHPRDAVATLWAYQPRAGDEWDLDRGDMLKVVGIWDDGWATGYKLTDRAEDWEASRNPNRDSGVSNGSTSRQATSAPATAEAPDGEIRAFPLVCVCLPQHWRKTIEGDGGGEHGASGSGPGGSPMGSP